MTGIVGDTEPMVGKPATHPLNLPHHPPQAWDWKYKYEPQERCLAWEHQYEKGQLYAAWYTPV